jgi:dTMP kinase
MFITFEGGEGCGKSTHSKILKRYLESLGFKVVLTYEPGDTSIGKLLRRVLLKGEKRASRYTELFLFAADRTEHIERVIRPALKERKIIICDRFIDSTVAYQCGARGLPIELVKKVNSISSGGIKPNITFLLDIPPKEGIKRGTKFTGKDVFESEKLVFHEKVRKTYLSIAKNEPGRVKVIDSRKPVKEVKQIIRKFIDEKLGN